MTFDATAAVVLALVTGMLIGFAIAYDKGIKDGISYAREFLCTIDEKQQEETP